MAAYFLDSSALIKRYLAESGTGWTRNLCDPAAGNLIYLGRITGVEVVAAVARRQRGGSLSAADMANLIALFRHHFAYEYRVVEITTATIAAAMTFAEIHGLRGYDAVRLAATVQANNERLARGLPPLTLVSADTELNAAGAVEALAVEDPNTHR